MPFGSTAERHTIAVRNAFASIGIHIPKIVDRRQATAWLTDRKPITMIAGEAPEILDPRGNTGLAPGFDRVARMVTIKTATGRDRMAKVVVLYKNPKNAEAFDKHYSSVHIPLAKKIPGLKKYDISTGAVGAPTGPSGIHLVATLYFDSADALKAGLASAEGRAAAGDLANFADGGAELYFFDTKEV